MCDYPTSSSVKPEQALSDLVMKEISVRITPNEIRLFLKLHWKTVTRLAHEIHGDNAPAH